MKTCPSEQVIGLFLNKEVRPWLTIETKGKAATEEAARRFVLSA
jgi:hypothetical protein